MLKKNKITGAMLFLLSAVFAFAVIAAPGGQAHAVNYGSPYDYLTKVNSNLYKIPGDNQVKYASSKTTFDSAHHWDKYQDISGISQPRGLSNFTVKITKLSSQAKALGISGLSVGSTIGTHCSGGMSKSTPSGTHNMILYVNKSSIKKTSNGGYTAEVIPFVTASSSVQTSTSRKSYSVSWQPYGAASLTKSIAGSNASEIASSGSYSLNKAVYQLYDSNKKKMTGKTFTVTGWKKGQTSASANRRRAYLRRWRKST